MNTYSTLRKQNNGTLAAVIAMVMCVVLSATVLLSRLALFAAADTRLYIPLTQSDGITTVREGTRGENGQPIFADTSFNRANHVLLTAKPNMQVKDDNTVWTGDTNVEIFKVSYANGQQQVTVNGGADKVIAPGTENIYTFGLYNTGNVALDYNVKFNAICEIIDKDAESGTGEAFPIPVYAAVSYTKDSVDTYLYGAAGDSDPIIDMVDVRHNGTVGKGNYIPYTLYWQWPFEENDTLDTQLGDLAAELALEGKEIRLTVTINTYAEYSGNPDADDGIPKTGDDSQILVFGGLMGLSAVLLLFLLIPKRRQEEEHA